MKTCAIIPVSRFTHAKTRLSPTLSPLERQNLLKSMLKDVIKVLKNSVDRVMIISSDKDVLEYVNNLGVQSLKEQGKTDLNGALKQAVEYCKDDCSKVLIVPSDIPLIGEDNVRDILKTGQEVDVVIAPAKGGGTNALLIPSSGIEMMFGECSFFKHLKEAEKEDMTSQIFDSFYLSLDVNTAEDLGEIMLHGKNTETCMFLEELKLNVRSNHGTERLQVIRN